MSFLLKQIFILIFLLHSSLLQAKDFSQFFDKLLGQNQNAAAGKIVQLSAADFQNLAQDKNFYQTLLPLRGTCTQTLSRSNPNDASSGMNTQVTASTFRDCLDLYQKDQWGQNACPERAYQYSFTFQMNQAPAFPGKANEKISAIQLGERVCQYKPWLESRADFKTAIFFDQWSSEEKQSFYNFIRKLHRGQNFDFRSPWEGPAKTRENCSVWLNPAYRFPPVHNGAGWMVDPGGCKDWRGSPPNYTDAELRLSWVGQAALSSFLVVSQQVSWGLPDTPEKLRLLFPNSVWTHHFEPEGFRLDMEFADASKVYYFYLHNGILDKSSQWNTLRNLIQLGKVGEAQTAIFKFHHGTGGCGFVRQEVIDAKAATGEAITTSDAENFTADCDAHPFSVNPKDFDLYMSAGTDNGCTGMGRRFFHSLNFLNIPTKYDQYSSIDPRTGRASHWSHAYSIFYLNTGTYGIGHNDDIYTDTFFELPPESILFEERYFNRLYKDYDTNDTIEASMNLPACLALLHTLPQRCCLNPNLSPYVLASENYCRSRTYVNHIYDANGQLISQDETVIDLLTAEENDELQQVIRKANAICFDPNADRQAEDLSRAACVR